MNFFQAHKLFIHNDITTTNNNIILLFDIFDSITNTGPLFNFQNECVYAYGKIRFDVDYFLVYINEVVEERCTNFRNEVKDVR